jgi:hypothetical protein
MRADNVRCQRNAANERGNYAYQNCEADKEKIGHEISWLREPWGSGLKLAPICVHCRKVNNC